MTYYEINETQARQAKGMWSFSDYAAGSETEIYRRRVDEAYALCEDVPEERKEKALYYADMYAKKLAENINKGFRIELMCPSVMISGAGNFPVRKKEKQNAARDRNMEEWQHIQGYLSKIKNLSHVSTTINSGDENAEELLQDKVNKLEALQAEMKAANAHYRKNKTMRGFSELSDEDAEKMGIDIKNDYWGAPYPTFELTNNNAKLKAAKDRLARLSRVKAQDNTEIVHEHFKVVRNTETMRLQLFFDGKPDEATRTLLKQNGFKWAPSQSAWQRQLTNNAIDAYRTVAKQLG